MKITRYIFLLICVAFKFISELSAQSCSDVFLYNYSESYAFFYYHGLPNDVYISADIYLHAISNSNEIHESFGLGETLRTAANHLKNKRRIWFKVKFLPKGPIPSVKKIVININGHCLLLCTGSEPSARDTRYYAGYTFYPKGHNDASWVTNRKCPVNFGSFTTVTKPAQSPPPPPQTVKEDIRSYGSAASCSEVFFFNYKERYAFFYYHGSPSDVYISADVYLSANSNSDSIHEDFGLGDSLISAQDQLSRNERIWYKVKFLTTGPIPDVTKVIINTNGVCKLFCQGTEPSNGATRYYTGYTFYPKGKTDAQWVTNRDCSNIDESAVLSVVHEPASNTQPHTQNMRCGQVDSSSIIRKLIFKGTEIDRGSWPWLVALFRVKPESESFQCGGSLLSERAVLTSAHCIHESEEPLDVNEIELYMGVHDIRRKTIGQSVRHYSKRFGIHPDYRADLFNFDADIAIIITTDRVIFTSSIRPVCIWEGPPMLDNILTREGIVVGWGQDESGKLSNVPRRVKARIVSDKACLDSNENFQVLTTKRNFCAGNLDGSGPCSGDSGGGLMLYENDRWQVRGTVSVSFPDNNGISCNLTQYVVYTDIAKFSRWVRTEILNF